LPEFGRKAVHVSVDLLHQTLGVAVQSQKYDALPTKLQFVLVVLNVERICCAACELLQGAKVGKGQLGAQLDA